MSLVCGCSRRGGPSSYLLSLDFGLEFLALVAASRHSAQRLDLFAKCVRLNRLLVGF